ncbi:tetratricopeptide repeat protein [Desulfurobacterium sp.]
MRAIIVLLSFIFFCNAFAVTNEGNNTIKRTEESVFVYKPEIWLKKGMYQYKIGSYNAALEYFLKILAKDKKRDDYYRKALFMLSKTYMKIGRKIGDKEYLWQALDLLQLYFNTVKNVDWDFYYTKARIYENLGFYDKSLDIYRVAFLKAKNDRQQIKTVIGILRSAVYLRRPDIVDEYYILLSTSPSTRQDEKELEFLKGLILFSKGKYREAFRYFFKTYRKNEAYLIENPEYYYLVAEDIYRKGDYRLAEQLFKRIISLTRDKSVIRKAMLRLGDTELKEGDKKLAVATYYNLVTTYPDSPETTIAKLKLIALMEKDPALKYRLQQTGIKAFNQPLRFVLETLIHSRDTYLGAFALANFGAYVLQTNSDNLFKQLEWEISLVFPKQLKYEQKEFIVREWKPYLLKLASKRLCELYKTNPDFFKVIFDKETLIKIAKALGKCNERKERLNLIRYIAAKWRDDNDLLMLAEALTESKDFNDSLEILKKVKKRSCRYYKIYIKNLVFLGKSAKEFLPMLREVEDICPSDDIEVKAYEILASIEQKNPQRAMWIIKENKKQIAEFYDKDPVLKLAIYKTISYLLAINNYEGCLKVIDVIEPKSNNCFLASAKLISLSRLDKINLAEAILPKVRMCKDTMSRIAQIVYEDQIIYRELKNE